MMRFFSILFFNLFLLIVLGELVARVFPSLFEKYPPYNTAELDEKLGWRQKPNYTFKGEHKSLNGEVYPIDLAYDSMGFRKFSNRRDSLKKKVFVIGDSFTQAIEVSNGRSYFDHLENDTTFEVSAYGMAGFGTLQELMIMEEFLKLVEPHFIVLQFCSNDFIDNHFKLEQTASYRVGLRRPYYENEHIVYRNPLPPHVKLLNKSRFMSFINDKWLRLRYKLGLQNKDTSEKRISESGLSYSAYAETVDATRAVLQKMKTLAGPNIPIIVMNADFYSPQQESIQEICKELGIQFIPFPVQKMNEKRAKTETFALDGFHWNEHGHRVIGENLLIELRKLISKN